MMGAQRGFTIVEVMIVLSISGVMLASAATVFGGRQQATEFSQAVYDLQSQIQSFAEKVSSRDIPGLGQQNCTPAAFNASTTYRPLFGAASNSGECIYLGQAIQFTQNSPTVYAYPIFGLSTIYNNSVSTGSAPALLSDAHPEPAINDASATPAASAFQFRDTYTMLNGLQVSSATWSGTENDILGLYSSLQDNNTSGNEISVTSYPYTNLAANPELQIKNCIEGSIGACTTPNSITSTVWKLCVTDNTRQAQISLKGTATGIVTSLNMNGCS
jgi:prepilin-type N-terminal cleavage/methylation domain-containing protein